MLRGKGEGGVVRTEVTAECGSTPQSGWISYRQWISYLLQRQPFLWNDVVIPFPNGVIHRLRHG